MSGREEGREGCADAGRGAGHDEDVAVEGGGGRFGEGGWRSKRLALLIAHHEQGLMTSTDRTLARWKGRTRGREHLTGYDVSE